MLIFLGAALVRAESPATAPAAPPTVGEGLGVDIDSTDPQPGEIEMIRDAGVRWIRTDLTWATAEKNRGIYDFSPYGRLADALDKAGVRAVFTLTGCNPLYDNNAAPGSPEARKAFADFAAAAVGHFKDRGYLWEIWNEPNRPRDRAAGDFYPTLAYAVASALHAKYPAERFIGPATVGVDRKFIESCRAAKLFDYWAGLSVHPFRQTVPETAEGEYLQLRQSLPPADPPAILCTAWGYSTAWPGLTEQRQAELVARELLTNVSQGIGLSIWHGWRDSGDDASNAEHRFGLVRRSFRDGQTPPFEAKPAYLALRTLGDQLGDMIFDRRLWVGSPRDYVLLFRSRDGKSIKLAAWTAGPQSTVTIPAADGAFVATSLAGDALPDVVARSGSLSIALSGGVEYLSPRDPNSMLLAALAEPRLPRETLVRAPADVTLGGQTLHLKPADPPRLIVSTSTLGYQQASVVAVTDPPMPATAPSQH